MAMRVVRRNVSPTYDEPAVRARFSTECGYEAQVSSAGIRGFADTTPDRG
jgi:hypothetical protein